jgi:hypothetical protein
MSGDQSSSGKLAIVALIALSLFVSAVRPLTRPAGHLIRPLGLTHWSLLSEAGDHDSAPVPQPTVVEAHVLAPPLTSIALLVLLKTRRAAFRPVPVRRLKLLARSPADSLSSD